MGIVSEQIGSKIKTMREAKGLTQEKLAELATLNRTFISSLESGKKSIRIDTLERVLNVLEVSFSEFFLFDSQYSNNNIITKVNELLLSKSEDEKEIALNLLAYLFESKVSLTQSNRNNSDR